MRTTIKRYRADIERCCRDAQSLHALAGRAVDDLEEATEDFGRGAGHSVTSAEADSRYLVHGGRGERVFDTIAEAREWANVQIEHYREIAKSRGEWPTHVNDVAVWRLVAATHEVKHKNDGVEFVLEES